MVEIYRTISAYQKLNIKSYENKQEIVQKHIINVKENNRIPVAVTDITNVKNNITDFEKTLLDGNSGVRVLSLRSLTAQHFYEMIAKIFKAELVIVSGDYKSRYVSQDANGKTFDKPKIVVNVSEHSPMGKIFAHELFHHIMMKIDPAHYKALKKAVLSLDLDPAQKNAIESMDDNMQEEVFAEIFAHAITQKAFFKNLSTSMAGKGIARRILTLIINRVERSNFLATEKGFYSFEGKILLNEKDLEGLHGIIKDMLGSAALSNEQRSGETKYHHVFGDSVKELKGYLAHPEHWLKGLWQHFFPKGIKSHRDIMSAIERLLIDSIKIIAKMKPAGMMVDYMADKEDVRLAHIVSNMAEKEVTKARLRIKHFKGTFNDFVKKRQSDLEDEIGRGEWVYTKDSDGNVKYKRVLNPDDMPKNASTVDITATKGEEAYIARELRDSFRKEKILEKMHDDIVRGGLVFTRDGKPHSSDILKAKALGYSDEVISAYSTYQELSDGIFAQLQEIYPNMDKLKSHYGQSLRWYDNKDIALDQSFDAVLHHELGSKLTGNENFSKGKNMRMTTQELADKYNIHYKTIDPNQMILDYIRNTQRIINMDRMLAEGMETNRVRIFSNDMQAARFGMVRVNDKATQILRDLTVVEGYKVVHTQTGEFYQKNDIDLTFNTEQEALDFVEAMPMREKNAYSVEQAVQEGKSEVTHYAVYADGALVDYYNTKGEAQDAQKEHMANRPAGSKTRYVWKTVTMQAKTSEVARYYFTPDLARMLDTLLAEDKFRGSKLLGLSGNTWMNIKNKMTAIEFALSGFHAFTITQEMVSSYMGWSHSRDKRTDNKKSIKKKIKDISPKNIWGESRELVSLFSFILEHEGRTDSKDELLAAQERLGELLGIDNVDAASLVYMYFHAGGLTEQDRSLRSNVHEMGEASFYDKEDKITFDEDGKAGVDLGKASPKAIMDSLKAVLEDQKAQHPNSPFIQSFNVGQFAALEASTAWLMENFIPKVKMATWMREYSTNLEKARADLENGVTTEEEIARQTMKFVEDRFGEVNWRNMWMNPTIKTSLQFMFRSFTWFTGSWKALSKAGIDVGKLMWFKVKDVGLKDEDKTKYELTEKGVWGMNALLIHMLTVQFINVLAYSTAGLLGELPDDDDDDDESVPLATKLLFPHLDPSDPSGYASIPSYVTEGYKIFTHLGFIGGHQELHKLVTGRTNSLVSNAYEVVTGLDWRGVRVRDPEDPAVTQAVDSLIHMLWVAPISFSTVYSDWRTHGVRGGNVAGIAGLTSAPAVAKRSLAVNLAYTLRREEHRGKPITADEAELKDSIKRAAYQYAHNNKKPLNDLLLSREITIKQRTRALAMQPTIDGKKNPLYKDPLLSAVKYLSIEGTLKVWKKMTDNEKKKSRLLIITKFSNIIKRKTRSGKAQEEIVREMKELKVI